METTFKRILKSSIKKMFQTVIINRIKSRTFLQRNELYKGEEQNGNFRNKIHNIANFKIPLNWLKSTVENMGKTWGGLEDRTTEAMQLKQVKRLEKLKRESGTCEMESEDLAFLC